MWAVTIDKWAKGRLEEEASFQSDIPAEVAKWLRQQAERIRKEQYMMPKLEGEEPLAGASMWDNTEGVNP